MVFHISYTILHYAERCISIMSCIDGISGEKKRSLWLKLSKGHVVVNSAEEFYNVARGLSSKINVLYVSEAGVQQKSSHLDIRWQKAKPVKTISTDHLSLVIHIALWL